MSSRFSPEQDPLKSARRLGEANVFFRSLSTMMGAGIPINQALGLLAESSGDPVTAEVSQRLAVGVESGRTLSASMRDFPNLFSAYHVGLIRVGEQTGSLVRILDTIAQHTEKSEALRLKLKSAVTYPAVLVCCSLLLLFVGPSWLLEGQLTMLEQSGQTLPRLTRIMIAWTDVCSSPLFVALALTLVVGGVIALRKPEVRENLFLKFHQVPLLSHLLRLAASARFARALEVALHSGLPILKAFPLSAQATGDPLLQRLISTSVRELERGDSVGESLRAIGFFPPAFHHLVQAGDESGRMPAMLSLSAEFAEMELELALNSAAILVEPILLLLMGVFTALVLVATLQPTLSLLNAF